MSELNRAKEFLKTLLADGPLPYQYVFNEAAGQGLRKKHVREAKRALGLVTTKVDQDTEPNWMWSLPGTEV